MKTLSIFRHAKSGWDDPVARDFDRPLNKRGKIGARLIGAHMKDKARHYDRITASPAVRVVETLDEFFASFGDKTSPTWDKRIYLASADSLLDVIQETPDNVNHLMLAGHNPGLEDLILMLVPEDASDDVRDAIEDKLPTGTIVEMQFPVDSWAALQAQTGKISLMIRPRDLDPELGPGHSF